MNTPLRGHIDHFVLATADLELTCAEFEGATGVRPAFGGAHQGRGTHNALVGFDDSTYLEIIAPDPAQPPSSSSAPMARLTQPKLIHWAVRCAGLENASARLKALGWTPTRAHRMNRTPPGGERLEWELLGLHHHRHGGLAPFFIDWLDCPHPARTSPCVGPLMAAQLTSPEPMPLASLIAELGIDVAVQAGDRRMTLTFASPRGEIRYEGTTPAGFTLGD